MAVTSGMVELVCPIDGFVEHVTVYDTVNDVVHTWCNTCHKRGALREGALIDYYRLEQEKKRGQEQAKVRDVDTSGTSGI